MSTLNEYQLEAGKMNKAVALFKWRDEGFVAVMGLNYQLEPITGLFNALGMMGEAGEVSEKIKKHARDGVKDYTAHKEAVVKELGDVLWYLSQLARDFGATLQDVADANLAKLRGRQERGTLSGSGDDR